MQNIQDVTIWINTLSFNRKEEALEFPRLLTIGTEALHHGHKIRLILAPAKMLEERCTDDSVWKRLAQHTCCGLVHEAGIANDGSHLTYLNHEESASSQTPPHMCMLSMDVTNRKQPFEQNSARDHLEDD